MNIRDYIGKRCLLKVNSGGYGTLDSVDEFKILEVSPTGNWTKLMNLNAHKFWKATMNIAFVEELVDFKADKPE